LSIITIEPENYKVMAEAGSSKRKSKRTHGKSSSSKPSNLGGRPTLKDIAASTLKNIELGSYEVDGISYDLKEKIDLLNANTTFYAADSDLSEWSIVQVPQTPVDSESSVHIKVCECSTLTGARKMKEYLQSPTESPEPNSLKKVGVLSFGSAKNPGGGFIKGAQAQVRSPSFLFSGCMRSIIVYFHKRKSRSRAHQQLYPVWRPKLLKDSIDRTGKIPKKATIATL
jgi:hypothetical protein